MLLAHLGKLLFLRAKAISQRFSPTFQCIPNMENIKTKSHRITRCAITRYAREYMFTESIIRTGFLIVRNNILLWTPGSWWKTHSDCHVKRRKTPIGNGLMPLKWCSEMEYACDQSCYGCCMTDNTDSGYRPQLDSILIGIITTGESQGKTSRSYARSVPGDRCIQQYDFYFYFLTQGQGRMETHSYKDNRNDKYVSSSSKGCEFMWSLWFSEPGNE
ncbi:hypothetical protein K501DRAFT_266410 [Backusella circina FSU 941]|nr:hypothetical protein K501DRAFT_266410 [Backusella circina FSU 941]